MFIQSKLMLPWATSYIKVLYTFCVASYSQKPTFLFPPLEIKLPTPPKLMECRLEVAFRIVDMEKQLKNNPCLGYKQEVDVS